MLWSSPGFQVDGAVASDATRGGLEGIGSSGVAREWLNNVSEAKPGARRWAARVPSRDEASRARCCAVGAAADRAVRTRLCPPRARTRANVARVERC